MNGSHKTLRLRSEMSLVETLLFHFRANPQSCPLNYQRVDWKDAVRTHPLKLRMRFQNPPLTTLCSPGFSSNHFAFCHALQSTSSCSLLSTSAHSGYRSRYRTASGILPRVFCARGILVLIHHLFLAVFPGLHTEYRHVKKTCTIPSCPSS